MKVAAHELTDAEVPFISIVNRGANKVPFRFTKGAGGMFDLGRIFKTAVGIQPAVPVVAFIAVSKSVSSEDAIQRLTDAGFETDKVVEQEAGSIYLQGEHTAEDKVTLFRANDEIVLGVSGPNAATFMKAYEAYDWQSTEFGEVLKTSQTIPMFHTALTALSDVFYNSMRKADSPEELRDTMAKAMQDFQGHINDVLGNVPVTAFKLETVATPAKTAKADDLPEDDTEKTSETPAGTETVVEKTEDEPAAEDAKDEVQKTEADASTETAADADADKAGVEKAGKDGKKKPGMDQESAEPGKDEKTKDKKADEETPAWAQALVAQVASLGETVKEVQKSAETQAKTTQSQLAKFDEVLGGGLIGGDTDEPDETRTPSKKADKDEDDDMSFGFDTAIHDPFKD